MEYVLEAESLGKVYGKKVVLFDFSLKIRKGSIFGLLGPNGAGKSTFIRIVSGLEEPDDGTLSLLGEKAGKKSRRKLGVAPQENAIYNLLTCMENLTYFGSLYGVTGKTAKGRAASLLSQLGLQDKKDTVAGYLSGGMKRRLSLACALMHNPEIIMLDEPTTGLDPATRIKMWETVRKVVRETKATLILTTHYMEEAEALCDRIAFVNTGKVVAEGTPNELKKRVGKEIAKLSTVPGQAENVIRIIKAIRGIDNVTETEHGVIVEGKSIAARLPEIAKILEKHGETVVEMTVSRPSLEDVFLKMTGLKLREVAKAESVKRNWKGEQS
ncbi:MAG: ABC transporter ATP-binding protein [Candidatus Micrarchaeota archaeon]|nr:ABC transporter ATP-binding protein [Candidatus Micrarchaeota archaeon]